MWRSEMVVAVYIAMQRAAIEMEEIATNVHLGVYFMKLEIIFVSQSVTQKNVIETEVIVLINVQMIVYQHELGIHIVTLNVSTKHATEILEIVLIYSALIPVFEIELQTNAVIEIAITKNVCEILVSV